MKANATVTKVGRTSIELTLDDSNLRELVVNRHDDQEFEINTHFYSRRDQAFDAHIAAVRAGVQRFVGPSIHCAYFDEGQRVQLRALPLDNDWDAEDDEPFTPACPHPRGLRRARS